MNDGLALGIGALMLVGNAYFVGAEFAVMAARRSQLEPLAEEGNRGAARALAALDHVGSMLACAQLGITVCSLLLGAVAESALHHLLSPWVLRAGLQDPAAHLVGLAVGLLIVAYLHVVVGEMIPKNLAIAGPERAAIWLAPSLHGLTRILGPLVHLLEWLAKLLVRLCGVEPKAETSSAVTVEEMQLIVAESAREGLIEKEHELVKGALEFSDKRASDVAVPVRELTVVRRGVTPEELEHLVAQSGYSRYPVVDGLGSPAGYVHLKDVLYADDDRYTEPVPAKRIRALASVAPTDEVEDVLASMQATGAHLARVVETDGSVSGVVFLEDVIEELVGEVTDGALRQA